MTTWAEDYIAGPMCYKYAVLFPRARVTLWAYMGENSSVVDLPTNICPAVLGGRTHFHFEPVSTTTGLANVATHLYGYRQLVGGPLALDPLMTGWYSRPSNESSIVS